MKQPDYAEQMLKARMAETLFEELMKESGNTIYRFGYESIMQNLTQLKERFDKYNGVGKRIRSIPDFVVLDKEGKPLFVEIKFRWNSQAHEDDAERFASINELWAALVVVVSCEEKPYFRVSWPPYFGEDKKLMLTPLLSVSELGVKPDIYKKYEVLVEKFLKQTLVAKK